MVPYIQHSYVDSVPCRYKGIKDEIFSEGTHFVVRHNNFFQKLYGPIHFLDSLV